jgi:hypothetical protein
MKALSSLSEASFSPILAIGFILAVLAVLVILVLIEDARLSRRSVLGLLQVGGK